MTVPRGRSLTGPTGAGDSRRRGRGVSGVGFLGDSVDEEVRPSRRYCVTCGAIAIPLTLHRSNTTPPSVPNSHAAPHSNQTARVHSTLTCCVSAATDRWALSVAFATLVLTWSIAPRACSARPAQAASRLADR